MGKSLLEAAIEGDEKLIRDALLPASDYEVLKKSLQQCQHRRLQPDTILPFGLVVMMIAVSLIIGWQNKSTATITVLPTVGLLAGFMMLRRLRFFDPVPWGMRHEWKKALSAPTFDAIEKLDLRQSRFGGFLVADLEGIVKCQPAIEDLAHAAEKSREAWTERFMSKKPAAGSGRASNDLG